jgi:hypothetical protein
MPFAAKNKTSLVTFDGAVEITDQQYQECLAAQLNGNGFDIRNGEPFIFSSQIKTVYKTSDRSPLVIPDNDDAPAGYTELVPGADQEWSGSEWETPLPAAKTKRKKDVEAKRDEILSNGWYSSTIDKTFPCDSLDMGIAHIKRVRSGDSSDASQRAISDITLGNPTVILATGNQFKLGDRIYISGVVGPTELNGRAPRIVVDGGNNLSVDFDSTGMDEYVSGGTIDAGWEFLDIDKNFVGLKKSDIESVTVDLTDYTEAVVSHAVWLSKQIDALTTTAEVEAFDIDAGWPAN